VQTEQANIEAQLRDLLTGRLRFDRAATVDAEASLLDLGLDSTAILSLVVGIEERFGIEIPDRDITLDNFSSLRAISHYVARNRDR
jgi:acyl carrier protein